MAQSFLNNDSLIVLCLTIAVFRIYLEVIKFDFSRMPLVKYMGPQFLKLHRYGFYLSVGYFILFAPGYLLS